MATLTSEQQAFVVQHLAEYHTPSEVVELVKEEYGIEVERQQVQYYDPTVGAKPAKKWRDLFWEVRKGVQEGTTDRAIKYMDWRLQEYEKAYRRAMQMNNLPLAMDILKQAAKELGGMFTNRRKFEHMGEGGGPLEFKGVNFGPADDD